MVLNEAKEKLTFMFYKLNKMFVVSVKHNNSVLIC